MAKRLQAMGAPSYGNRFQLSIVPGRLQQPLLRRKPTIYFVNSMSDLFQDGMPEVFIDKVFDVIKKHLIILIKFLQNEAPICAIIS